MVNGYTFRGSNSFTSIFTSLLSHGKLLEERVCSSGSQVLFFMSRLHFGFFGVQGNVTKVVSLCINGTERWWLHPRENNLTGNITFSWGLLIDPITLRKAKIVCNFGLSECNRLRTEKNFLQWANSLLNELAPLWSHLPTEANTSQVMLLSR